MRLRDVYDPDAMAAAAVMLYQLLAEREPQESISHRSMPAWIDHVEFVKRRPYAAWHVVEVDGSDAGACYLTHAGEIGIGILRKFRGKGYAKAAITELMRLHPRQQYLANVNERNEKSLRLFEKMGFKRLQITLSFEDAAQEQNPKSSRVLREEDPS